MSIRSAVSAAGLVLSRNIVRSAVCLLFTLVGVAGLYFLLSAEFLAAVQLVHQQQALRRSECCTQRTSL